MALRTQYAAAGEELGQLEFVPPPRWSIAQRGFFASDGRLWVRQAVSQERRETWSVLTADGVVATHSFPAGLEVKAATRDLVAGVQQSDEGVPIVLIYRFLR